MWTLNRVVVLPVAAQCAPSSRPPNISPSISCTALGVLVCVCEVFHPARAGSRHTDVHRISDECARARWCVRCVLVVFTAVHARVRVCKFIVQCFAIESWVRVRELDILQRAARVYIGTISAESRQRN